MAPANTTLRLWCCVYDFQQPLAVEKKMFSQKGSAIADKKTPFQVKRPKTTRFVHHNRGLATMRLHLL